MSVPPVVPAPASITAVDAAPFRIDGETALVGGPDATAELAAIIRVRTGLDLQTAEAADDAGDAIEVRVEPGGAAESYRIVADAASIIVTGADDAGLFYGIHTLAQLITATGEGWVVPAVDIDDAPRFAYRGVMLDVARHFHPVGTVQAFIDRAASLKFNVLHLHLTDDQGWRVHLTSRPLLTAAASSSSVGGDPGGFYTQDDYREIVRYAASRHMTVVPEIDMPGHTHAVGLAYPELVEDPVLSEQVRQTVREFGGELPQAGRPYDGLAVGFSSLRIHDEATYDFVADVFGEVARLTPGPYLHLGGDEALGTSREDFDLFVSRASGIIADLGRTPVAWHEAGSAKNLADSTVGQYWGFVSPTDGMDEQARAFVANGGQLILSPADATYLDMKYPSGHERGLAWAKGPTSVERAYSWEPSDVITGIDDADILGVEAALWTELVRTPDDIDVMAFPRIAAVAEAAWSPPTGTSDLRTWPSFRERVGALGPLWSSLGIRFHPSDEIPWAAS